MARALRVHLLCNVVYDNEKHSSRSRKLAKQRVVPAGTASAVQFSENCLKQEGGDVKVDSEIIFQTPLLTGEVSATTSNVCVSEGKEDGLLPEIQTHESPQNEETSSFLNVAAPEFVPVSTPGQTKDKESNVAISTSNNSSNSSSSSSNSTDVSSSQPVQPHKHRHFNKHQPYQQYHMIPDYSMMRAPIPPHLPLPYPYFLPHHSQESLLPLSVPYGYPYPPMPLQQSRVFTDSFPARHPHVYAGMHPEFYMMEYGGPFPQDMQNRLYSWNGGVPEQPPVQSPEPESEVHDNPDGKDTTQESSPPSTSTSITAELRSHDTNTSPEHSIDQAPIINSSNNPTQFSTVIETDDPDEAGGINTSSSKTDFSDEIHPIKDNSTGQVVDTGYIHKHIDNNKVVPSLPASKASLECDDATKCALESNSDKTEVIELSQETVPSDNTVQQDPCRPTVKTATDVCDETNSSEDANAVQTEHTVPDTVKPEPTITSISVDNNVKVVPEKPTTTTPLVGARKVPSTTLGNKLSEQKTKSAAGETHSQQHKVDRKPSSNSINNRTSNQFSSNRENNYHRSESQTSTGSNKISSKGATKSGPSIILRSEKRTYSQSSHVEPVSSNKDYFSTSGPESKKFQSYSHTNSASKETNHAPASSNSSSSSSISSSSSGITTNTPNDPKKQAAWGQTKKWSQLFNSSTSSKDTVSSLSKEPVAQSDVVMSSSSSETVVEQTSTLSTQSVNKQLISLGGMSRLYVVLEV